jgi:hypothetical protein
MIALLCFFLALFASPFKSKSRLEAEKAVLRLRRRLRSRPPTRGRREPVAQKMGEQKRKEHDVPNDIRKLLEASLKEICHALEVKLPFRFNDENERRYARI